MCLAPKAQESPEAWGSAPGIRLPSQSSAESATQSRGSPNSLAQHHSRRHCEANQPSLYLYSVNAKREVTVESSE